MDLWVRPCRPLGPTSRFRESHQPSGLRWFRALYWCHPLPLFPRGGVYPSPYPLPRTQDPGFRESLGILIATFLAISLLFFFASFFDAFLGRSWLRFPSQLASQNRSKSKKNRRQDAIHLGLRFLIDFWSVLVPNLEPLDFKKTLFSALFFLSENKVF